MPAIGDGRSMMVSMRHRYADMYCFAVLRVKAGVVPGRVEKGVETAALPLVHQRDSLC